MSPHVATCEYCSSPGKLRLSKAEGADEDAYVCDKCWELLKNPVTAIPLLRGHLSLTLRENLPAPQVKKMTEAFLRGIAGWRPRKPV